MTDLFRKKSLSKLLADAASGEKTLKKTLGMWALIALGIGAIIGAGLFVRTAAAAAENAGSGVTMSFVVAAVGCAFAGLCYAEFAAMIPIAGSAYTYAYTTMGELVAWIIGWALIMEYALGAATVSIAWSEYLNNLLGMRISYEWCHSPFEKMYQVIGGAVSQFPADLSKMAKDGVLVLSGDQYEILPDNLKSLVTVYSGMINLPALVILLILTLLLIKGTQESAIVNGVIVFVKVAIVLIFIVVGWQFINPANHTPYLIPEGVAGHSGFFNWGYAGIIGGAGVVFFAFIGFDAVSTAAQEAKNPKRDMPIGILGSLAVCTILYVLFSYVLTGVAHWSEFGAAGKEASVTYAIQKYMVGFEWLGTSVTIAILAGFSSVILVMLMGQSRVFFSMSKDGLIPRVFSDIHPKFRTPYKSNMMLFIFVGLFAAFVPGSVAGDLTSFGTLFAFILVCVGIWIMRKKFPLHVNLPVTNGKIRYVNTEGTVFHEEQITGQGHVTFDNLPAGTEVAEVISEGKVVESYRVVNRPFKTPMVPLVPILGIIVCTLMVIGLDNFTLASAGVWMAGGLIVYFAYSIRKSHLNRSGESR
jgi:basic amino acid/polyamine antiporter, APA family